MRRTVRRSIKVITLERLKELEPGVFASGSGRIKHPWFNSAKKTVDGNGEAIVNWVAVRGGIHDWAIYHSLDANFERAEFLDGAEHLLATDDMIEKLGAKLTNEHDIRKLVPCDDEAFAMYRY